MEIPDQASRLKPGHSSYSSVCMFVRVVVLHGFCEQNNCFVEQELVQQESEVQITNQKEAKIVPDPIFSGTLDEGAVVPNIITLRKVLDKINAEECNCKNQANAVINSTILSN